MVKRIAGGFIPFIFMHFLCCGALLIFLISGGYLLLLRQEGSNKIFLLPALILTGGLFWLYRYHGKCCDKKGHRTWKDKILNYLLYIVFSMVLMFIFIIYVFIPWWIPNYKGGMLLP